MEKLKELSSEFYNDLVKCSFLTDVEEILNNSGLVNIDFDDIKNISKGKIVGSISRSSNDFNIDLKMDNRIRDEKPTDALIYITSKKDISLSDVNNMVTRLRDAYDNLNIVFGCGINDELASSFKIQVLFTIK